MTSQEALKTPVVLLIFKRPQTTQLVFEAIRQARPQTLLIVSNLPPADKADQLQQCQQARAIVEAVDWPCEVFRNYAETYMSCKDRIVSGLNWVFATVEQAIILEDDCVPEPSFFGYCQELLQRYASDQRVMAITGDNFNIPPRQAEYSYSFSRYTHFWGWATWRRAWQHYDADMALWPEFRQAGWLSDILPDSAAVRWWDKTLQQTYAGQKDTWDYQWIFSTWVQGAHCIVPCVNLVTNLGFGADAAHNRDQFDWRAKLLTQPIALPLRHPPVLRADVWCDRILQSRYYGYIAQKQSRPLPYRIRRKLHRARMLIQQHQAQGATEPLSELLRRILKE
ncbi:glycosyltransferase family 2 protein [Pseudanabaena sp. FACHB-2040]|uniref:glycosyltransferase family 2 protein n=1 Tax=Pseudanabaena sp. FACHB-2040 TaxID=2692859 RepID=UPI00168407F7|nr:glycosyltransferase family 2 protein [Pseudanabaena sp. FACHB-2040]MBD2258631.1 glycosyltransferase family 2 protein [Pseudanabaena sp. FACHB-2040]